MTDSQATFVADVHLAKLARHLRMLGFDTLWRQDIRDDEMLNVSETDGRKLLTRDRALWNRGDPDRRFCVTATAPGQQLAETLTQFGLLDRARSKHGFLTRCLECNALILPAQAHQLTERLPGSVLQEFDQFFLCPRCERIYWRGSHFDRMSRWVDEALNAKGDPTP